MTDKKFAMNLMNSVRMPVGQYKGQDLDVVMASDPSYIEWISGEDWFREKYAHIYKIIINGNSDLQESPEHNALQARFLDEEVRMALADWYLPKLDTEDIERLVERKIDKLRTKGGPKNERTAELLEKYPYRKVSTRVGVTGPAFEELGIDVSFICARRTTVGVVGRLAIEEDSLDEKLKIEVKPTVGDDYPAVLRQIMAARVRYRSHLVTERVNCDAYRGMRGGIASLRASVEHGIGPAENIGGFVLVAEKYTGSSVSIEQMGAVFKAQNVSFALLSDF